MNSNEKNPALNPLAPSLCAKIVRLFCASIPLATLMCVSAPPALADDIPPPIIWSCWVGNGSPISIKCIRHRSLLELDIMAEPDEELEAVIVNLIEERIANRETAGLDELVKEHSRDLRKGTLWFIPIGSYPNESSWREDMPARLVRAVLCTHNIQCMVRLNPPAR